MWAKESIFYHIYPLGFCERDGIKKVESIIEHIKYVGANAVYFGPVFESKDHGYDTSDYFKIDRRLGSNDDFREVCKSLHQNGIKIVLDGVFNHVGRDFWAFLDVKEHKGYSKYCNWFNITWDCNNRYNDGFCYQDWEGCDDLVKLNLNNPEVKNHIFDAVRFWINEFEIDGLRLDVAYCLDRDFLKELHNFCKTLKNDFWLMGEILHGDYRQIMNNEMLDSATNYECYKGLYSSFNDKNMFEIAHSIKRQESLYTEQTLYNFLDNHDVNRIATALNDKNNLKLVYTLLFAMKGIPSVYYGSEFGIDGDKNRFGDKVLRPYFKNMYGNELTDYIHNLSEIRKNNAALSYGTFKEIKLSNEVFIFEREYNGKKAICALNSGNEDYYRREIDKIIKAKDAEIISKEF